MNSVNLDARSAIAKVQAFLAAGEAFEIVIDGTAGRRTAMDRALTALKNDRKIRFFDIFRSSKIIGIIGLVNETKRYDWNLHAQPSRLIVVVSLT